MPAPFQTALLVFSFAGLLGTLIAIAAVYWLAAYRDYPLHEQPGYYTGWHAILFAGVTALVAPNLGAAVAVAAATGICAITVGLRLYRDISTSR